MKKLLKSITMLFAAAAVLSGCDPTEPNVEPTGDTPTIEIGAIEVSVVNATVNLTVAKATKVNYTYYIKDARPAEPVWNEQAVEADGAIKVEFAVAPNYEAAVEYTFEANAVAVVDAKETKSEAVTKDFSTEVTPNIYISNMYATPFSIVFDVAYASPCDGYVAEIWEKSNEGITAATLADKIDNPDPDPQTWVIVNTSKRYVFSDLIPNFEYVIGYVGTIGARGACSRQGEVQTYEFKTPQFAMNTCEATAAFDKTNVTELQISATVSRDETTGSVMAGAVKKADMGGKTIDEFLTVWLNESNKNGLMNCKSVLIDSFDPEKDGEYAATIDITRGVDIHLNPIVAGTEYIFWNIALNQKGDIGRLTSVETKTTGYVFDSTANVSLTLESVSGSGKEATFSVKLNDGCVKFVYQNITPYHNANDSKEAALMRSFLDGLKDNDRICNSETLTIKFLEKNKKYTLYVLPVDASGQYGKIQSFEFTTTVSDVTFDGSATCEITVGERYLEDYNAKETPHYNVSVTKGTDCDGFYYYYAACAEWAILNLNALNAQAVHALDHNLVENFSTENLVNLAVAVASESTEYTQDYYFFAIPYKVVEGKNVYGTPKRVVLYYDAAN